jgi:hypothetical protein
MLIKNTRRYYKARNPRIAKMENIHGAKDCRGSVVTGAQRALWRTISWVFTKLNRHLVYDLIILPLVIYLRRRKHTSKERLEHECS